MRECALLETRLVIGQQVDDFVNKLLGKLEDWHIAVDVLVKTAALHSSISSSGTLAATQLCSSRQLFTRVPRQIASTCSRVTRPPSRSSSTTAPYACCSLYGNPSLIDLNYKNPDLDNNNRVDWRARVPNRKPIDVAVSKSAHRRRPAQRIAPHHEQLFPGQPYYAEVKSYTDHFLPLLEAERAEDEALLRQRLASWSLQRLKKEGYCITGLSAHWLDKLRFGRHVASFTLGPGVVLPPEHRFEKGTQVLVTHLDPLKEDAQRGSVVECKETELQVAFHESWDVTVNGSWRLDIGRSNIVFERMREAIRQLHYDPGTQEANEANSAEQEDILHGTFLRDILLRSFPATRTDEETIELEDITASPTMVSSKPEVDFRGLFKEDARIISWATRHSQLSPILVEGDPVLKGLNATQVRAVAMMLLNRFCLVQGPPGTGKTKTIIETVKLLKTHFRVPYPILIATFTNVAVDNLVEGILGASLRPLRVGPAGKIQSSLENYTIETQVMKHPEYPKLERVRAKAQETSNRIQELHLEIRDLESRQLSKNLSVRLANMKADLVTRNVWLRRYKARAYQIYLDILYDIIMSADVVCTTCISSASSHLSVVDFPIVLIDEASMSTEPASLVPMMKGSRHVALIGDHKQLPPVITSPLAQAKGLGISMFERLSDENFLPSIMLDTQYRMHPAISRFPSHEFYNESVRDGTINIQGQVASHLLPPQSSIFPELKDLVKRNGKNDKPSVVFLDHVGSESKMDRSRVNRNEAKIVCSLIEDLLLRNPHLKGSDIGVIAPYVAQISLLTRLFNIDVKHKERFEAILGPDRARELLNVEIKTVDGFEGREKDVVIFSTVRNNPMGHIGFLADRRRLNVGLTRAKRGLFIVGSISTLKQGKMSEDPGSGVVKVGEGAHAWRRYAEFLAQENLIIKLQGEVLTRILNGNMSEIPLADRSRYEVMRY